MVFDPPIPMNLQICYVRGWARVQFTYLLRGFIGFRLFGIAEIVSCSVDSPVQSYSSKVVSLIRNRSSIPKNYLHRIRPLIVLTRFLSLFWIISLAISRALLALRSKWNSFRKSPIRAAISTFKTISFHYWFLCHFATTIASIPSYRCLTFPDTRILEMWLFRLRPNFLLPSRISQSWFA